MEASRYAIVLVLAIISSMCAMSMAQSSSPGISSECTNVLVTLSPCLNYITGNSSTPSSSCCSQLGSVVKSSPQCLCQVLNGGASGVAAGLNINQTQALTLPNACNVQTPPVSTCNNGAASPAGSPFGSPTNPSGRSTPTGEGGDSDGDSSDATMSKSPVIALLLTVVFVATRALAF